MEWTRIGTGLAGVGTFLVLLTLVYTAKAARAAQTATDIAQKALAGIERPFLVLEFLDPLPEDDQGEFGRVRYRFTNYGKTPAVITYTNNRLVPWRFGEPQPDARRPGMGGGNPLPHGIVVGADKSSREFYESPLSMNGIEFEAITAPDRNRNWFFTGYVRYRDLMGGEFIGGYCYLRLGYPLPNLTAGFEIATPHKGRGPYNYDRRAQEGDEEPLGALGRVHEGLA